MPAQIGLDIGSYSIKLVQAEKKGQAYNLLTFGEIRTPADINSDAEKDQIVIALAIKNLVVNCKVNAKEVALALQENNVYSQVIELPPLTDKELESAISYEAEQYIPVPLEEVQFEYLVLKNATKGSLNEKTEVLLVAAKKTSLEKMVKTVERAGLTPVSAETEILAIQRVLNVDSAKTKIILNLGHRSTELILLTNQVLKAVRTINTGGEALTRCIASFLNIGYEQAEQYKIKYGFNVSELEGKIVKAIMPVFSVILDELKRMIAFNAQKNNKEPVDLLVLSGGGGQFTGLSAYLAQNLNLQIEILRPFDKFVQSSNIPKTTNICQYSVAAGLSMRENDQ